MCEKKMKTESPTQKIEEKIFSRTIKNTSKYKIKTSLLQVMESMSQFFAGPSDYIALFMTFDR